MNVVGIAVDDAMMSTTCEEPAANMKLAGRKVRFGSIGEVTLIVPVNPLMPTAETVTCVVWPGDTETFDGVTVRRKSGPAVTVIVALTVLAGPLDGVKVNVTGYVPGAAVVA